MVKKAWWVSDALGITGPYKTKKAAKKEGLGLWGRMKRGWKPGVYYDPEEVENIVWFGTKGSPPWS